MASLPVTRVGGPLDMLDRAFLVARRGGPRFVWRPMAAGAVLAAAGLLVYYVERVEGIRSLRPLLAFVLVLAWWGRSLMMARAARESVQMLWPGAAIPEDAGRPIDVVRTASVVAMGLWVWLWLLVGASLLGTFAVPLVVPVLALRGAGAPSWLARAGCTTEGGVRSFLRALSDTAGRRATTITVELLVLIGALGLTINLYATIAVFVLLARSFLGLDVAFVETFFSVRNVFLMLGTGALSLVLIEPLRAALSAVVFVDSQVRQEGLDLRALVGRALEAGEQRGGLTAKPKGASAAALVLLAGGLSVLAPAPASAQEDPPAAELTPLPPGPRAPGVAPTPDPESFDPAGTGMPPKDPARFSEMIARELARLAGGGEPGTDVPAETIRGAEDARVQSEVERILRQREFAEFEDERGRGIRDLIERFIAWLLRERLPESNAAPTGPSIPLPPAGLFIALGGILLLGILVYLFATRVRSRKEDRGAVAAEDAASEDPRERAPDEHLDDAAVLAGQGKYRDALRALYLATLVALDRRRLIAFDPALTNWQYIRQMPRGEARTLFTRFTRLFDYKWYGDEPTTERDYELCRTLASSIVRETAERAA